MIAALVAALSCAAAQAQQAEVLIGNATAAPVDILWLGDGGQEQPIATLQPGQGTTLGTTVGHSFRARSGGAEVGAFTATGTPGESWIVGAAAVAAPPPSAALSIALPPPRVSLTVANAGSVPAELLWVAPDGSETAIGVVESLTEVPVEADIGQAFRFRVGGVPAAEHVVTGVADERFVVGAAAAPPGEGAPAAAAPSAEEVDLATSTETVSVEFRNVSASPVECFVVDAERNEVATAVIDPESAVTVVSSPGLWWRFRIGGAVVGEYETGAAPTQSAIVSGPDVEAADVVLDFQNPAAGPVDYFLVADPATEVFVKTIQPGFAAEQPSKPNEVWRFRRNGELMAEYLADNRPVQEFVVP